jgi:hypothetical protein
MQNAVQSPAPVPVSFMLPLSLFVVLPSWCVLPSCGDETPPSSPPPSSPNETGDAVAAQPPTLRAATPPKTKNKPRTDDNEVVLFMLMPRGCDEVVTSARHPMRVPLEIQSKERTRSASFRVVEKLGRHSNERRARKVGAGSRHARTIRVCEHTHNRDKRSR